MEDPWEDIARRVRGCSLLWTISGPDVIHLNGWPWLPSVEGADPCSGTFVCYFVVGSGARRTGPRGLGPYYLEIARGLAAADAVAAPSKSMFWLLHKNYGPFSAGGSSTTAAIPLFHSGKKGPVIFTAGRLWDGAKNLCAPKK